MRMRANRTVALNFHRRSSASGYLEHQMSQPSFFQNLRRTVTPVRDGQGTASLGTPSHREAAAEQQYEEARRAPPQWSSREHGSANIPLQVEGNQRTYSTSPFGRTGVQPTCRDFYDEPSPLSWLPANHQTHSEVPNGTHDHGPFSPPKDDSSTGGNDARNFDSGPFSFKTHEGLPARADTASPAYSSHTPRSYPPQSSDGANFTSHAPTSNLKLSNGERDGTRTWGEWVQKATGYAALSRPERAGLLVLFAATPALLWACNYCLYNEVTTSSSATASVAQSSDGDSATAAVDHRGMTYFDVAASVLLGVLLSFTLDANTAATDAYIGKHWEAARATLLSGPEISVPARTVRAAWHWYPSASFSRFAAVTLLAGYGAKVTVAASYLLVAGFFATYARRVLVVLVCAAVLYALLRGLLAYMRSRRVRGDVVDVLAVMTKALLLQKERTYPIPYLLEEVEDAIRSAKLSHILSPQAAVLGSVLGSGSKTRRADGEREGPARSEGECEGEVRETRGVAADDILGGFALRQLWKDVQRAVERDSRIQKIDVIVDGKKQPCWRVLTGSTNARI